MKDIITGAEALMRSLEHQGVKTIFGYPGGSIMPVFDALYDHRKTLNHILVRHEQGATHAAQGFARVSGEVGVCLVTSGPGATNTITGIADAMIDSTPLVVIAGQVGTGFLGTDAFQEVDLVLRTYKAHSAAKYGVKRLGIFGSVARGEQTEHSDVDICYEGDAPSLLTLERFQNELENLLGSPVDLIRIRERMNSRLKQRILKESIYV